VFGVFEYYQVVYATDLD